MAWVEQISYINCEDGTEFIRVSIVYNKDEWKQLKDNQFTTLDDVKVTKDV